MQRQVFIGLLLSFLIIFSSGCWNRRELTDLAVVSGIGIDRIKEDGKIALTVQIIKPAAVKTPTAGGGEGGEGGEGVLLMSSTGQTIQEAVRNLVMQSSRKPFFAHNKVIVVGEELARAGISPVLDFFTREHEFRRRILLLVVKGEARDVMEVSGGLEKIPADKIQLMMRTQKDVSTTSMVKINDFVRKLSSKNTSPVASRIEILGADQGKKEEKQVGITGTAVFKKDKLVGWLNKPETRGLLWITGKVNGGIIVVKSPGDESGEISLEILSARSKILPEIRNGQVYITVEVQEEGNIGELIGTGDLTDPEKITSLEKRKAMVIKNEIKRVLEKAQYEFNADIFGFGEAVHRKFPKYWREIEDRWEEKFPTVEVTLKVNAKIRHVGLTTNPIKP